MSWICDTAFDGLAEAGLASLVQDWLPPADLGLLGIADFDHFLSVTILHEVGYNGHYML